VLVVFDITSRESFNSVKTWQSEIENNADEDVLIYLVGNFADEEENRVVRRGEAIALVKELGFHHYIETSAFSGLNINCLFETLTKNLFINHAANMEKFVSYPFKMCCFTNKFRK